MTFVCMTIVDKLGRRVLLVTGMFGMSVFAFSLALFRILAKNVKLKHLSIVSPILH